jgi:hypothetical protein
MGLVLEARHLQTFTGVAALSNVSLSLYAGRSIRSSARTARASPP